MLTDEWWKMAIWIFVIVILVLLFCCLTKCCYLLWDCCTDSYWGCCPRKGTSTNGSSNVKDGIKFYFYGASRLILILPICSISECCKRFLLLRWCGYEGHGEDNDQLTGGGGKYEYEICRNEDFTTTRDSSMVFNPSNQYKTKQQAVDETKSGSDTYVDFTLRNVEDVIGGDSSVVEDPIANRWKDTSLTVLSSMGNKRYIFLIYICLCGLRYKIKVF